MSNEKIPTTTFKRDGSYVRNTQLEEMNLSAKRPRPAPAAQASSAPSAPKPAPAVKKAPPSPGSFNLNTVRSKAVSAANAVPKATLPAQEDLTLNEATLRTPTVVADGVLPTKEVKIEIPAEPEEAQQITAAPQTPVVEETVPAEESVVTTANDASQPEVDPLELNSVAASANEDVVHYCSADHDVSLGLLHVEASGVKDAEPEEPIAVEAPEIVVQASDDVPNFSIVAWVDVCKHSGCISANIVAWLQRCIKAASSYPTQILALAGNEQVRFYNFYKSASKKYAVVVGSGEFISAVEIQLSGDYAADVSSDLVAINGAVSYKTPDDPAAFYCERTRKPVVI